jgi:hypothetical protein
MDDLMDFIFAWIAVVGGAALLMFTLRLLSLLFEGIMLGGWF